jgi:lipid-binding SYLF domain-containing protein
MARTRIKPGHDNSGLPHGFAGIRTKGVPFMTRITSRLVSRRRVLQGVALAAFAPLLLAAASRPAAALTEPEDLVERARLSLLRLMSHRDTPELKDYVGRARGVVIVPALIKGGFIIGGEGGAGVMLVKGSDGSWSSPTFYTLAAGSIGLQIGGQVSEVVFALMSDGAVDAILSNNAKLGADLSVAIGPMGKGVEASTTTNLNADVYAFSTAVGAFAGGALEGAAFIDRQSYNDEYYNAYAPARAIVIDRKFYNGHADPLRAALP